MIHALILLFVSRLPADSSSEPEVSGGRVPSGWSQEQNFFRVRTYGGSSCECENASLNGMLCVHTV
jgi:hypothetical protein